MSTRSGFIQAGGLASATHLLARSMVENGGTQRQQPGFAFSGPLIMLGRGRRLLRDGSELLMDGWQFYRNMRGGRQGTGASANAVEVTRSITVGKPADELQQFWRDPEHLTDIMGPFVAVSAENEDQYHWEVGRPDGRSLAWETQIVEDAPGEVLRWESVEGAVIPNEGVVRFRSAPGERGTEVTLAYRFDPPGGAPGKKTAKCLHFVFSAIVNKVLHRFKSLAETDEIPTLKTNPSARGKGDLL